MKYEIEYDDSSYSCPICKNTESQQFVSHLPTEHLLIDNVRLEIITPSKLGLYFCKSCEIAYKNHYPSAESERLLTEIWKKHSDSRYQSKGYSKRLKLIARQIDLIARRTPKKTVRVMDIGVGEGSYLKQLENNKKIEIYLMDIDAQVLSSLSETIDSKTLHGDASDSSFCKKYSGYFDVITAFDLIEHVPSKVLIDNILEMLSDNGTFIAETGDRKNLFAKVFGIENWWYVNIPEHKVFWTKDSLFESLEKAGFIDIDIRKVIHKDRRFEALFKDAIKSLIWMFKSFFNKDSIKSGNKRLPKFPLRDQLYLSAKKRSE